MTKIAFGDISSITQDIQVGKFATTHPHWALLFDIVKGLQEDEIIHKDNNPRGLRHITDDYKSK